uniref:Uncharacterized protein n=1 Tax=Anguilla anguilla TaxID=7936 RepID=A0A0E9TRZ7_ANGAN
MYLFIYFQKNLNNIILISQDKQNYERPSLILKI